VGTADERNENRSRGINLVANKPYYIRARMKEGGGAFTSCRWESWTTG
jgi:hypothetical protein